MRRSLLAVFLLVLLALAGFGFGQAAKAQTVCNGCVAIVNFGSTGYATTASPPTSGSTVTEKTGVYNQYLPITGTLALLTVALPPTPKNGDPFCLLAPYAITTLTLTSGSSISDPPMFLNANADECVRYTAGGWQRTTDIGLPSPAIVASIANASTQMAADLAAVNAGLIAAQAEYTAVDALYGSINQIGQASATIPGVVTSPPNLPCGGTDSNSNIIACATNAFDPYPARQLAQTAAGTNQATCFQLTAELTVITGGGGGGVCLPAAVAQGIPAIVVSMVNSTITVYPYNNGTDTISGGTAGAGVTLLGNWTEMFRPTTNGNWTPTANLVPNTPVSASLLGTDVNGAWISVSAGTALALSAGNLNVQLGTTGSTAAAGNDSRITGAAPLASPAFTGTPTAPTPTLGDNSTKIATTAFVATNPPLLTGTTGSIGGSSLTLGSCASGTVAVTGATTGMVVSATPVTYPGAGFDWGRDYVSSSNTVTVQVCADVAGTPTASAYNVRVIK